MSNQSPIIRFKNPPTMPPSRFGFSHVVEATGGKTIYIAGQVALDSTGNLVGEGDLKSQTRQVFTNLKMALESVGADFNSVVKLNFYLLDISQIQIVREVRDQFVNTRNPPASTAVQIQRLALPGLLIEIEAIAVVPT